MEFISYLSEKINPLQIVIVLAIAVIILSFFGLSKKRSIKKFIIAVAAISLFLAFYLNIQIFISSEGLLNDSLTFGILQVIETGLILFSVINLLFFISTREMDHDRFTMMLMLLLFSAICAISIVIADDFILMFTGLAVFIVSVFQLTASLNSGIGGTGYYMIRYFLRSALVLILFFFGFSIFYGAADLKGFSRISGYEGISNPLTVVALVVFAVAIYLYFFLFPFQNPYLGFMKKSNAASSAIIWFLYFPVGIFVYLKFSDLFGFFIEKNDLFVSIILIVLTFICMFAGNLGAVKTKSIRRMISFLFLYFIGIFLLNVSMYSSGIINMPSMKWLNIANVFLLILSFIPLYSIFSKIEHIRKADSISVIRGFGRSNVYLSINLIIVLLSWFVVALYLLPFKEFLTSGIGFMQMGTVNMVLMAIILITFIFLVVNVFKIIYALFRKPMGKTEERIIFPRFYNVYITFFTLVILIITVKSLMEISGIDIGFLSFKVTGISL